VINGRAHGNKSIFYVLSRKKSSEFITYFVPSA
jgi:hypothetical protein